MKNKKSIFIIIVFILTVALIVINRNSTQDQIDMANKMQLSFTVSGEEKVYYYDENHKEIFKAILDLHRKSAPVDALTVAEELKKRSDYVIENDADRITLYARVDAVIEALRSRQNGQECLA